MNKPLAGISPKRLIAAGSDKAVSRTQALLRNSSRFLVQKKKGEQTTGL